jgi:hypothetical protein
MKLNINKSTLANEHSPIIIKASLYVLLSSTQTPKAAEPTIPPMINNAPNADV